MATQIAAVATLRPRVVARKTVGLEHLAQRLSRGGLASRSIIRMVLSDLVEQIAIEMREGNAVHLGELGRIGLELRQDGQLRPWMRFDPAFRRSVSLVQDFGGTITNRENLGLSTAEVIAKWNELHPEDPVAA